MKKYTIYQFLSLIFISVMVWSILNTMESFKKDTVYSSNNEFGDRIVDIKNIDYISRDMAIEKSISTFKSMFNEALVIDNILQDVNLTKTDEGFVWNISLKLKTSQSTKAVINLYSTLNAETGEFYSISFGENSNTNSYLTKPKYYFENINKDIFSIINPLSDAINVKLENENFSVYDVSTGIIYEHYTNKSSNVYYNIDVNSTTKKIFLLKKVIKK